MLNGLVVPTFLLSGAALCFKTRKWDGWIHTRDGKRCTHSKTRQLRPIILDVL
jgi:hypothetical protein